jgi:hypothetical protein
MVSSLQRRSFFALAAAPWAGVSLPGLATEARPSRLKLAAAWRTAEGTRAVDHVGVLAVDWQAGSVTVETDITVDTRAHGLLPLADGGFLVVAARPGRWLMRIGPQGQVQARIRADEETPARGFGGHVLASPDGQWLYTTETDPRDGSGWISVRDARSLKREASWPAHGVDPHHLVLSPDGRSLWLANGGISRTPEGHKRDLSGMDASLVQLALDDGRPLGQWRLSDRRLSIRHLAWNRSAGGEPVLGLALQAEHDEASARRDAPILALWDAHQGLRLATRAVAGAGYAGDISPGPAGGFILSGQRTGEGLLWHPDAPDRWITLARVTEPCALAAWPDRGGVLIGASRGLARWDTRVAPAMLPWPQAMNPDNHWVVLA